MIFGQLFGKMRVWYAINRTFIKKALKIQEMVEIRWQSTNYIQF